MNQRERGLTIIEVVISMLVMSSMFAASLYAVAASRATILRGRDLQTAIGLADDLLGFVYRLAYTSPSGSILGIELGNLLGDKTTYDDVDDFHGWVESPPTNAAGTPIVGLTGWRRSITVEWVSSVDAETVLSGESGLKRITVVVQKNGVELARRTAIRTALSAESE